MLYKDLYLYKPIDSTKGQYRWRRTRAVTVSIYMSSRNIFTRTIICHIKNPTMGLCWDDCPWWNLIHIYQRYNVQSILFKIVQFITSFIKMNKYSVNYLYIVYTVKLTLGLLWNNNRIKIKLNHINARRNVPWRIERCLSTAVREKMSNIASQYCEV